GEELGRWRVARNWTVLLPAPAERLHFDRGEQRHRAAAIVGAVHGRAIQVVLLRGPCTRARTHVADGAVLIDTRDDGLPSTIDGPLVRRTIQEAQPHAARHGGHRHRCHRQLAIAGGLVHHLPPAAVV